MNALATDRWIEKRDPEELYAYIDVFACPISVADLTAEVHATMIRSRIKPLTEWNPGEIALYIALDCAAEDESHWVFELNVMLAKLRKERGDDVIISFRHEDQFGAFGKGGRELIQQNVDKAVEGAFMKYLEANFDLAPGEPKP